VAILSDIEFEVLKECMRQNRYAYKFADNKEDKTYKYMVSKGLTKETLADVVLKLKKGECYSKEFDDNPNHNDGTVYKFRTKQLGDLLYVKLKFYYGKYNMLILSIHLWGNI
jgi:hypothetical protein